MASASSTLRVNAWPNGMDNTQRRQRMFGTLILSPSGTYINTSNASSGIPLNWGGMQDANQNNLTGIQPLVSAANINPVMARFYTAGNETTIPDYQYVYNRPSSGSSTLRIIGAGTELTNNAAITADNIAWEAEWIREL